MDLTLKCETYVRFAKVGRSNNDNSYYNSVWLEISDGYAYIVATNVKIAVVELLGEDHGPDGRYNVTVSDALFNQCQTEIAFDSSITFSYNKHLKYVTAKTMLGYIYPDNALVKDEEQNSFKCWREWFPRKIATETNGAIFSNLHQIKTMVESAPSGSVIYQEHVDKSQPILVADVHAPNWFGLFMPTADDEPENAKAELPKWLKR